MTRRGVNGGAELGSALPKITAVGGTQLEE